MKATISLMTALALAFGLGLPSSAGASGEHAANMAADQSEEGGPEGAEPAAEAPPAEEPAAEAPVPIPTTEAPSGVDAPAPPDVPAPPAEAAGVPTAPREPAASKAAPAPKAGKSRGASKAHAPRSLNVAKLLAQGRQAERAQQYSRAVAVYERATRADPNSAEAFVHLGNGYFARAFQRGIESVDKDDAQSAVDAYETALGLDASLKSVADPYILYHGLAQCQESLGHYEKSLQALKGATKASPNNPMPHLYGARVRYRMRDFKRASANLYWSVRRARKLNMYPQIARLIQKDAMFAGLMSLPANKVVMDSFDALHRGELTEAQAKERIRAFGASDDFRDAVRDVPTSQTSRPRSLDRPTINEAVISRVEEGHRAFDAGAFNEAVTAYRDALSLDAKKGTMDEVMKSLVFERLGSSYRQMGHAGEAARILARAVSVLPNNSSARYELALCLAAGGRPADALTELNGALDTAGTVAQLRKILILSKTDPDLNAVRDLPRFKAILDSHQSRLAARR